MAELIFRDAVAADLPEIVAMLADDHLGQAREDASLPLAQSYLEAFAAIDAAPDQRLVVACEDGRVVGVLQLLFLPCLSGKGAWRGQIEAVRVVRDRRGTASVSASRAGRSSSAAPAAVPGSSSLRTIHGPTRTGSGNGWAFTDPPGLQASALTRSNGARHGGGIRS